MKQKFHTSNYVVCLMITLIFTFMGLAIRAQAATPSPEPSPSPSASPSATPTTIPQATPSASLSTNRSTGIVTYTLKGLDDAFGTSITIQATNTSTKAVWNKTIQLTEANCKQGNFSGTISLEDVKYAFAKYTVVATIGKTKLNVGTADFSIHTNKAALKITGDSGSAVRSAVFTSTEAANDVLVPGSGNQVSVQIWSKTRAASTATTVGNAVALAGSRTWSINVSKCGNYYDNWCAKVIVTNSKWTGNYTLASTEYSVIPTCTSFKAKKSSALEKKKSFAIELKGLKNAYGIRGVNFLIKNSSGKQVATIAGTKKAADGSYFYSAVTMKKLNYQMNLYSIEAVVVDNNGKTYTLKIKSAVDQRLKKGTLSVTKKKDATCNYKISGVYIPGNIKKIEFVIYQVKSGKKVKIGTFKAKASSTKKVYSANVKNSAKGSFLVKAYGYTTWGSKCLLAKKNFKLKKKDLGKNGWYYEKYNGKKYKFYYINNEKQIDLTKILNLKKSSATNTNNFYIEVNRAASAVTIYMYNEETQKYDIPVKTCSVCVGRDVSTNAGAGGLNENTSYTPLGTYSVCTNGQSVKYTMKPMLEPDGSTCYARWTTHIVGNVYFHSIAVGSQSHYALPAYRYNLLGSPASAGCIRMAVADAKWIYDYTSTGNTVKIIKGNSKKAGPLGKAPTIKVKNGINYDPTDPGVPDSRKKKDYKAKRISGYMTKSGKKVGY